MDCDSQERELWPLEGRGTWGRGSVAEAEHEVAEEREGAKVGGRKGSGRWAKMGILAAAHPRGWAVWFGEMFSVRSTLWSYGISFPGDLLPLHCVHLKAFL